MAGRVHGRVGSLLGAQVVGMMVAGLPVVVEIDPHQSPEPEAPQPERKRLRSSSSRDPGAENPELELSEVERENPEPQDAVLGPDDEKLEEAPRKNEVGPAGGPPEESVSLSSKALGDHQAQGHQP